ncbi:hypothetical protein MMC16_000632 [Acarospora aff. strigata]|nr:hypothetical protein [Acarospora aff. strigata]
MAGLFLGMVTTQLTPHEAVSGIFGSISLASWVFLLVPQLIENYKCGSADGVSLSFLTVWLLGDITNFFGAIWAGLVPTVIVLAVYFCFLDSVLITQCLYYNLINSRKAGRRPSAVIDRVDPDSPGQPLLSQGENGPGGLNGSRRRSSVSHRRRSSQCSHLPRDTIAQILEEDSQKKLWVKNTVSVLLVCATGAAGWAIAWKTGVWTPTPEETGGQSAGLAKGPQTLGYLSALFYLGARIPQIIKNYREQSCEGLSLLFFILSIVGNATYGCGILFHSIEKEYFLTNLPWLIGSLGTMVEDAIIFMQFRIYSTGTSQSSVIE